jgi:hypothetical protein
MLDTLVNYHKRKLEILINSGETYDKILKQSQILDKYINKAMKKINKI